jgi:phosphatidylinositol alpha-1,6-mannosyltransferase
MGAPHLRQARSPEFGGVMSGSVKGQRMLALVTEAFGGRGGIAQYNRDLLEALCRTDVVGSIDILPRLCPDEVRDAPSPVRQHGPVSGRIAYSSRAIKLAYQTRPDVVFCGHLYMAPIAALAAKLVGARLIVQLHGIEIWQRPGELVRRALEAADRIFCVSRDTRSRLLAATNVAPERVDVIPNTVAADYTPDHKAASRDTYGVGKSFVLLSVGRLDSREAYKGQDRIIERLPALIERGRDIVYLIAGEGDDRSRLQRLADEKGIASRVRFIGHVPRADLPSLYRMADLFVLPSSGEGFGIVFLEAMACGTPALGLAVGGATDALGEGELGYAPTYDSLTETFARAVSAAPADHVDLASRVHARFGRERFELCVHGAIARLAS